MNQRSGDGLPDGSGQSLSDVVFETAVEAILITDPENRIIATNPAFTTITGYQAEEVIGRNPSFMSSGHHDSEFYDSMWRELSENGHWQGEIWNRRKSGSTFPERLSIVAVRGEDGGIKNYIATFTDISKRKVREAAATRRAQYDALTKLPNRSLFLDRLSHAIAGTARNDRFLAIIFVDLDGFKPVNDSLGHSAGDQLLETVARRLTSCVRGNDTVARFGGDEFIVLLTEINRSSDAEPAARKILARLAEPFILDQTEVHISGSAGIAVYPQDGDHIDLLLSNADLAMYRAKKEGGNTFRFFTQEMNERALERMALEEDLGKALAGDELSIRYQPIMDVKTGRLAHVESLLRWHHPTRGEVSPRIFVPLAEGVGLMAAIGDWMLLNSCHQIRLWRDQGMSDVGLFANVSGHQFRNRDFPGFVAGVLEESGLPPGQLTLEVTEEVLANGLTGSLAGLKIIREMGIRVAIDDFGTGPIPLNKLKDFFPDVIKIGSSFSVDSTDGGVMLGALIDMAHRFKARVVVENIEGEEERDMVAALRCDLIQGYCYSQPISADAILDYWRRQNT